MRAVLTDVEGTTTSVSLVKDVLFPYARRHLAAFVARNRETPALAEVLGGVRQEVGDPALGWDDAVSVLLRWIDEDRKVTPLKTLQGLVWTDGYRTGELRGHVYADAAAKLREWRARGLSLYVYSSGSVAAQKLLFGHTPEGDLTGLFSGFFDTSVGGKLDAASYAAIASAVASIPSDIVFLSDHVGELDAARIAGMDTVWVDRAGSAPPRALHRRITTFAELDFESPCWRPVRGPRPGGPP